MSTTLLVGIVGILLTVARFSTVSGFPEYQYALPAVEFVPGPITIDRHRDIWFAEKDGARIGELRADGMLRVYRVPGSYEQIQALAAGADGKVWFTQTQTQDGSGNRVGYITGDGKITLYPLRRADAFVSAIAADPNGGVWVSEFGAHRVARVSGSGATKEFVLPGPPSDDVRSIEVDRSGAVWVLQDNAVVRLSRTGVARRYIIPLPKSVDGMGNMVPAEAGSWWMTAYTAKGREPAVWRFTIPDRLVRYALPGADWGPDVIASGSRGSAWMSYDGRIATIDVSGNGTAYMQPFASYDVWGMAADDLGDVWFMNSQSEKLGVFGPHAKQEPRPEIAALSGSQVAIVRAWRTSLQPRSGYNMKEVVADTLRVDGDVAIVGWSDENGNAATLLRWRDGRWIPVSNTNGNFYRPEELTSQGVPARIATQLLLDSNVILIPPQAASGRRKG